MTEFQTPVDIANRALQHLGGTRISSTLGFTEDSKNAAAMSFAYGKLRRAELRSNLWKFSTRKAVLRPISNPTIAVSGMQQLPTLVLAPAIWASTTNYLNGAIVTDQFNTPWVSTIPNNLGNNPNNSPFAWDLYVGPTAAFPWDTTGKTAYYAGDLVYTSSGAGTANIYFSLFNNNSDNPATPTPWDPTITYFKNQIVVSAAVSYISLMDFNLNQTPSSAVQAWSALTSYSIGNTVYGSDGIVYVSVTNANIGNVPTLDHGLNWTFTGVIQPWTNTFVGGVGSTNWLQLTAALSNTLIVYPIGTGPVEQASTRNIFRLPANFLREAPQDPKAGSVSYLGAPSGLMYNDWLYEGDWLISRETDLIVYRFVSDFQDVSRMDDLFCEGLAARMAYETCEEITQSTEKLKTCLALYKDVMSRARMVNAVETGAVEPAEDDWITTRI